MRIFACSFLMEFKAHIRYFLKITPQKIQRAINIQCAYFLYFHLRQSFFLLRIRLRPPPPHTATFRPIHIPPHPRVSWNATPLVTRRDFQLPVIRATKDKDFTVMSIHHLRDTRLSLKAIGLFSIILSLPPEWKFSVAGLAAITKDGITSWLMRHTPYFPVHDNWISQTDSIAAWAAPVIPSGFCLAHKRIKSFHPGKTRKCTGGLLWQKTMKTIRNQTNRPSRPPFSSCGWPIITTRSTPRAWLRRISGTVCESKSKIGPLPWSVSPNPTGGNPATGCRFFQSILGCKASRYVLS